MAVYFTDKTFRFQRALAKNNTREWFTAHKADYEQHLRQPFLRLIADLQAPLATISPRFRADPKPVGGSLFRIHRDIRYASDKTPYKTWAGARLYHERIKLASTESTLQRHGPGIEAPSFYLHIAPGDCFIGGGLWHPEPATQRRIRDFIVENPASWKKAVHAPAFRRKFTMNDESFARPPRGYPADHELMADLKRKNYVAIAALDEATVTGPRLLISVSAGLHSCAPLVDYLCAALDLPF